MYARTETKDLKGFDQKYVHSLYTLGVQYVDDFYSMASVYRKSIKNNLGVDDSELERLLKLAETVLDKDFLESVKNPPKPHPRGLIVDKKSKRRSK